MRLRQVALIAHEIAPVAQALKAVFGLEVAFRDPAVGVFGLANVVMPVGGEFLEVLEPIAPGASGGRYLARRGGDAGYMIILQDADALAHRTRIEAAGVRVIARRSGEGYRFTHFHPADCAGVLLSIDEVAGDAGWREPLSDWPPAGPDWRAFESRESLGLACVSVQARDPAAAAERFSRLLARPAIRDGAALAIPLDRGVIRFVPAIDSDGTGVVALDIIVRHVDAVLERARAAALEVKDGAVVICGVAIRPVNAPPVV